MITINAAELDYKSLNEKLRESTTPCTITGCCGQRFIAAGMSNKEITIDGVPGNALGAYLNGASITVHANAQDAVGDTMNEGKIIIHGSIGDAAGYAMRGGKIYVRGGAGYRAGIHMKAYEDKIPVMVIGGTAGSFLGEYQAGGIIVMLGLNGDGMPIINNFCATGMHGGRIYLRCGKLPHKIPSQVRAEKINGESDMQLKGIVEDYCRYFDGMNAGELLNANFFLITPNEENPYQRMYTDN